MSPRTLLSGIMTGSLLLTLTLQATATTQTEKLLDTTLFESNEQTFRWSEASTINLDGKNELLMAVTLFGGGGHDNSTAQILEFRSHDGGLTWNSYEEAKVLQENVGEENTMSPALLKLSNGDYLCFVNVKNSRQDCGPWVKRSSDGCKTWSELKKLPYDGYGGVGSDRAIQLSTGRVLLPCWVSHDSLGSSRAWVFYSDDLGETWKRTDLISTPEGSTGRKTDPAAEEPMILELKDGRLMMIMRCYLKSIYRSFSDDGGATWTEPESTGIPSPGSMATIKRLPNGDVLLIWNWALLKDISGPWPRNFITAAISKDDGKNFTSVRHLDGAEGFEGKITMANVVLADDDKVVITYSKSMTKKNAYNWRLQVIPLQWFYEGDMEQVYGESYLPTLNALLAKETETAGLNLKRPSTATRADVMTNRVPTLAEEDAKHEDLVASYRFEGREPGFAFDTSPNANDLTFNMDGEFPRPADGPSGASVQFDGKDGCLAAPASDSLHFPTGQFTVEALVYPTAEKHVSMIVTKEHQFEVALRRGKLQAAVMCSKAWGPAWVGAATVPLNEWSKIAVTFDGQAIRFYVNGEQVGRFGRTGKMDANNEPFVVGNCTNIDDAGFAGHIDELRIWNTVRYGPQKGTPMEDHDKEPRVVGATHQLFIDDDLIALNDGLERVVNAPARHHDNPVMTYEKPWEGNCVITWGSVLYDEEEQCFKIWYEIYKKFAAHGDVTMIAYATSKDGLHWDKPDLGIVDYLGSTANNIIMWLKNGNIDAPTVIAVPDPAPDCKYRMYFHCSSAGGIRTGTSPDGVHWNLRDGLVVDSGDRCSAMYDTVRKKWRVITRVPGRKQRTCGLWESDDGVNFEQVGELLAADDQDPDQTQLYGMIEFNYEGLWLGFLEPFFIPTRKLNTQLAYSRDALNWYRACNRQTFLDYGPPGSWDQAWVTPSHNAPIRVDDKLYIFYQGRQTLHWAEKPYGHIGSIGLAFLRPDGFVSLDSQWSEGVVLTTPLRLEGTTLHVNAFARPGHVVAEITDLEGEPIDGFSRDDCLPAEMTDALDHAFAWKGGRSLTGLADTPVRLRFYVRGAKLYSFWVE